MLVIIESGIRVAICHSVHLHGKINKKYMESFDKNKDSSYLVYLNEDKTSGSAFSKKLPLSQFERIESDKFTKDFMKRFHENFDLILFAS